MKTEKSYIVCATMRSGSSLLCELLSSTKMAGQPQEFLNKKREEKSQFPLNPYSSYIRHNFNHFASDNGFSGIKMMWDNLEDMIQRLRAESYDYASSDLEIVRQAFPDPSFIFIERENKLRQAISLARAEQTKVWDIKRNSSASKRTFARVTDFHITQSYNRLANYENAWKAFFQKYQLPFYHVTYDEITQHPEAAIKDILSFLDVPNYSQASIQPPQRKKQADWYTDYLAFRYKSAQTIRRLVPTSVNNIFSQCKKLFKTSFIKSS